MSLPNKPTARAATALRKLVLQEDVASVAFSKKSHVEVFLDPGVDSLPILGTKVAV